MYTKRLVFASAIVAGTVAPSAAIQCNGTDALLQVKFNIDQTVWDNMRAPDDYYTEAFVKVGPSGTLGNSTTVYAKVDYAVLADVKDFDMCVPRDDACVEVVVASFPKDSYEILWDGGAVETGPDFASYSVYGYPISSTEVGNACVPDCDDTEALFEYEIWTGIQPGQTFFVQDGEGNMVVYCGEDDYSDQCPGQFLRSLAIYRACLSRNGCYQLLTAGRYQMIPGYDSDTPSLSVRYDGKLVKESDSWLFESVWFGGDSCEPVCNEDEESNVELFLQRYERYLCGSDEDIDWELTLHSPQNGSSVAAAGSLPGCNNGTSIFYESVCLPKDSCATFSINTTSNDTLPVYSLAMDGIIYRSGKWDTLSKLNETINVGSCTASALCGSDQAVFELELQTPSAFSTAGKPVAAIYYVDIFWTFDYSAWDEQTWDQPLARSSDYVSSNAAYNLGSIYRTVECVPNTQCELQLTMTMDRPDESTPPLERYTMKRNGVTIIDQASAAQTDTELFGEDCNVSTSSSKLSGGVIVGIVLAALLSLHL